MDEEQPKVKLVFPDGTEKEIEPMQLPNFDSSGHTLGYAIMAVGQQLIRSVGRPDHRMVVFFNLDSHEDGPDIFCVCDNTMTPAIRQDIENLLQAFKRQEYNFKHRN